METRNRAVAVQRLEQCRAIMTLHPSWSNYSQHAIWFSPLSGCLKAAGLPSFQQSRAQRQKSPFIPLSFTRSLNRRMPSGTKGGRKSLSKSFTPHESKEQFWSITCSIVSQRTRQQYAARASQGGKTA